MLPLESKNASTICLVQLAWTWGQAGPLAATALFAALSRVYEKTQQIHNDNAVQHCHGSLLDRRQELLVGPHPLLFLVRIQILGDFLKYH